MNGEELATVTEQAISSAHANIGISYLLSIFSFIFLSMVAIWFYQKMQSDNKDDRKEKEMNSYNILEKGLYFIGKTFFDMCNSFEQFVNFFCIDDKKEWMDEKKYLIRVKSLKGNKEEKMNVSLEKIAHANYIWIRKPMRFLGFSLTLVLLSLSFLNLVGNHQEIKFGSTYASYQEYEKEVLKQYSPINYFESYDKIRDLLFTNSVFQYEYIVTTEVKEENVIGEENQHPPEVLSKTVSLVDYLENKKYTWKITPLEDTDERDESGKDFKLSEMEVSKITQEDYKKSKFHTEQGIQLTPKVMEAYYLSEHGTSVTF